MNFSLRVPLKNNSFYVLFIVLFFLLFQKELALSAENDSSLWNNLGPNISLRSSFWDKDKSYSDQSGYFVNSAWLSFRPKEILGSKLFFEAYLQKNDTFRKSPSFGDIREGYIEKSIGAFDIRAGRQIIIWGRADKVNPTDQWTVKNYTLLATDDEDQRLGTSAVNITWNIQNYRFIALLQPEWRSPTYPLPPLIGVTLTPLSPSNSFRQFGFKLDSTGGDFDWSLSYSNVISKVPTLSVLGANTNGVNVGLNFEPIEVFGADFAMNLGKVGIRGEMAYTSAPDHLGTNPLQFNREIFAVAGADHSPIENLNLNLQFLYKHVVDFQSPEVLNDANLRRLAAQENLISNQLHSNQFGFSFRPNYKIWNDTLEFEIAYVQWLGTPGGLVKPKITYAFNDHLKGMLGAEEYIGEPDSFFGRLSSISSLFTELRINF